MVNGAGNSAQSVTYGLALNYGIATPEPKYYKIVVSLAQLTGTATNAGFMTIYLAYYVNGILQNPLVAGPTLTTGLQTWSSELPSQTSANSTTLIGTISEFIVCVPQGCPAAVNGNLNVGAVCVPFAVFSAVNSATLTWSSTIRVNPWTFIYSDWFVDDNNPPPTLHRLPLRWHRATEQQMLAEPLRYLPQIQRPLDDRKVDDDGNEASLPIRRVAEPDSPVVVLQLQTAKDAPIERLSQLAVGPRGGFSLFGAVSGQVQPQPIVSS